MPIENDWLRLLADLELGGFVKAVDQRVVLNDAELQTYKKYLSLRKEQG